MQAFRYLRALTYSLIRTLPEPVWAQTAHHPERGLMSLDDWLELYSAHGHEHVDQINSVYAAWKAQTV